MGASSGARAPKAHMAEYRVVSSKFITFIISPLRRLVQVLLDWFMVEVMAVST